MSLASGGRIGSNEVTARLGLDGMGEVYRATDLKLKRRVAKVLPASVARDAGRQSDSSAKPKSSPAQSPEHRGHPRTRGDGLKALAMELVEGATLAGRIALGARVRATVHARQGSVLDRQPLAGVLGNALG